MQKLLLTLLLSQSLVATLGAQEADQADGRDLTTWMETENPTTADNPNPYATGNIAQLHFKIDVSSELGEKILSLLQFCSELTSQGNTDDAALIADLTNRFHALSAKEQQFVQVVIASTSSLRVATEELLAEYESNDQQ